MFILRQEKMEKSKENLKCKIKQQQSPTINIKIIKTNTKASQTIFNSIKRFQPKMLYK